MGFMEKLQSKLELFKLEQRYTKRYRRTTFISDAYYVDGEYVYDVPRESNGMPKQGSIKISEYRSRRLSAMNMNSPR